MKNKKKIREKTILFYGHFGTTSANFCNPPRAKLKRRKERKKKGANRHFGYIENKRENRKRRGRVRLAGLYASFPFALHTNDKSGWDFHPVNHPNQREEGETARATVKGNVVTCTAKNQYCQQTLSLSFSYRHTQRIDMPWQNRNKSLFPHPPFRVLLYLPFFFPFFNKMEEWTTRRYTLKWRQGRHVWRDRSFGPMDNLSVTKSAFYSPWGYFTAWELLSSSFGNALVQVCLRHFSFLPNWTAENCQ